MKVKKIMSIGLILVVIAFFSGCTESAVYIDHTPPLRFDKNNQTMKVTVLLQTSQKIAIGAPFNIENALFYLAKFAEKNGYNYVFITYPKTIKKYMPNSVKDLNKCINSSTIFGKCPGVKDVYYVGYSSTNYLLGATLYKIQPIEVPTVSVKEILKKYKNYSLKKDGYKVVIEKH